MLTCDDVCRADERGRGASCLHLQAAALPVLLFARFTSTPVVYLLYTHKSAARYLQFQAAALAVCCYMCVLYMFFLVADVCCMYVLIALAACTSVNSCAAIC